MNIRATLIRSGSIMDAIGYRTRSVMLGWEKVDSMIMFLFCFYQAMVMKAKSRIVIASLYLGTSPLETELVS